MENTKERITMPIDANLSDPNQRQYGASTAQVLRYIVEGLSTGLYEPGKPLNAARICKELELSKAPVREALHILAGQGIVDLLKNRGARIRELTQSDLLDLWATFSLTIGREIRIAARSLNSYDQGEKVAKAMAEIRGVADRMKSNGDDGILLLEAIHKLHDEIAALCTNKFLISATNRQLSQFWLPYVMKHIPLNTYADVYVANYERMTAAFLAGDGRTAESAFHYHARWSTEIIQGARPSPHAPWNASRSEY